jgi:3-oxoadipate enol-lactonase
VAIRLQRYWTYLDPHAKGDHSVEQRAYSGSAASRDGITLHYTVHGAEAPARWDQRAREAEEKGLSSLISFQESRWFSDAFRAQNPDAVNRYSHQFLAIDVASYAATCRMLGAFDLRVGLREPTAIVVDEEDYATPPAMARELQDGIAGATLQVIPKSRHLTLVEHPDIVAEALSGLLTRALSPS